MKTINRHRGPILFFVLWLVMAFLAAAANAQAPIAAPDQRSSAKYLDQTAGMTVDEAVRLALENNGELLAFRKERDAARALVRQAGLRANPKLDLTGTKQIGGKDNSQMAEVMLPLELGGRRRARVAVAERELAARELEIADRERTLAADVRLKFGEALAAIFKLNVAESALAAAEQSYTLVAARVTEGKIAPLEQNMFLVEVNRLRAMRETAEGKAEAAMFELRNMIGKRPDEPLRLRGDFEGLIAPAPNAGDALAAAITRRPDLLGAKAVELLADARIEAARSEGSLDASVKAGYQRMNTGYMLSGYDDMGILRPIRDVTNFFTFGLELDLPVRNRNQGTVEAAISEREAARRRVEFGELSVRRDVAAAIARYDRAARALSIFRVGVRDQANANLQVIWQTYELGARNLIDYIAEERRFIDVENELIDAQFETYSARVEIMRATSAPELTQ